MTTLIATVTPKGATFTTDSGITSSIAHQDTNKIATQGTWLIACAGSVRQANILHHAVRYPKVPAYLDATKDDSKWLSWFVNHVVPAIRKESIAEGVAEIANNEISLGGSALLATHGKVFEVDFDLASGLIVDYWAKGSGRSIALGALTAFHKQTDWLREHRYYACDAINIAKQFDPYTRGRIYQATSQPDGKIVWHRTP